MSDELDLDAIGARAEAAAPGPWVVFGDASVVAPGPGYGDDDLLHIYDEGGHGSDEATFIAHARTDVPALVAEVRRLRALVADQCPSRTTAYGSQEVLRCVLPVGHEGMHSADPLP